MQLESLVYAITLCVYVHAGLGIRSACLWACVVRLSAGLHIFFAGGGLPSTIISVIRAPSKELGEPLQSWCVVGEQLLI